MDIKQLLTELGFNHFVGPMWKHGELNMIISYEENMKPIDILKKVYNIGKEETKTELKTLLGIKS